MIYPIVLGILLAVSHSPIGIASALIVGFIVARAVTDIFFPKRFITGTPSPFVFYVQNLSSSGDVPRHPWLGYLLQSCLFYIPMAFVAFFVARFFIH